MFEYKAFNVPEIAKICTVACTAATEVTQAIDARTCGKNASRHLTTKTLLLASKLINDNPLKLAPTSP
ncbi:MAG: hypothetical protein WDA42_07510 [Candidatus Bathyarchaeia archaeon]